MMEYYMKKAAQEEKKKAPRQSNDEMPPPPSLHEVPGKRGHHMGDYIPQEELEKFLATCNDAAARKAAKEAAARAKIQADNVGQKLLSKMGWKEVYQKSSWDLAKWNKEILGLVKPTIKRRRYKLTDDGSATPAGVVAAALAHGFGLFVAVSIGANISGGHVNPAVTFGALLGGHISLVRTILYWIAQCLGSVVACLLLNFATGGLTTSAFSLSSGVTVWNALVFEIVMTFGLVYTVYATAVDPKKGNIGIIAPLAIGLIVGANILAGGAFDGASMNPAVSFGPAVVSWTWTNQWVYWVGPLVGSAIAALVYDVVFMTASDDYEQLPGEAI